MIVFSILFLRKYLIFDKIPDLKKLPNLLIIAGTGRNSGKTTLACSLISRFSCHKVTAVKISPHKHDQSTGSVLTGSGEGFEIFREFSETGNKDTARMLAAGATGAYYIFADDKSVCRAFDLLLSTISDNGPVICESPVLRRFYYPGLFLIADSTTVVNRKQLQGLTELADLTIQYETGDMATSSISFRDGGWIITG